MGSYAYELGKRAALEKSAVPGVGAALGQGLKSGLGRLGGWASKGLVNYGKGLVPQVGKQVAGVATRTAPGGFRKGVSSAGSGLMHGITGGRWMPKGVVSGTPFRYARGIADTAYRNPYTALITRGIFVYLVCTRPFHRSFRRFRVRMDGNYNRSNSKQSKLSSHLIIFYRS